MMRPRIQPLTGMDEHDDRAGSRRRCGRLGCGWSPPPGNPGRA